MPKGGLTDAHKKALAKGRREAKAVRDYLEAMEASNRRTRAADPLTLKKKLDQTQAKIAEEADPARRLELIQDRLDLEARLAEANDQPDMDSLEKRFKSSVKEYSERKGISYTAWREAGVPAAVLRDAGIPRTRRTT